jgi:hypothetical protein
MIAKVLTANQYDGSGFKVLRVYLEPNFDQAKDDMELMASVTDQEIRLHDAHLYGSPDKQKEIAAILTAVDKFNPMV